MALVDKLATSIGQSQEALAAWPANAARQVLCSLAEYVVDRRR